MLKIANLHAQTAGKTILKGLNLTINPGEFHAVMGPNGAGKSTLTHILAGNPNYQITEGEISLFGKPLEELETNERAAAGLFLTFQYPVEIPGVSVMNFLKASMQSLAKARSEEPLKAAELLKTTKETAKFLGLKQDLLKRHVNCGFSGGEKKRFEMLQMMLAKPTLCLLDEPDSGLDVDALKSIAAGINSLRDQKRSFLTITHYQRLLNHAKPDHVHIFADGKIVQSGDIKLAHILEEKGYRAFGLKDSGEAA